MDFDNIVSEVTNVIMYNPLIYFITLLIVIYSLIIGYIKYDKYPDFIYRISGLALAFSIGVSSIRLLGYIYNDIIGYDNIILCSFCTVSVLIRTPLLKNVINILKSGMTSWDEYLTARNISCLVTLITDNKLDDINMDILRALTYFVSLPKSPAMKKSYLNRKIPDLAYGDYLKDLYVLLHRSDLVLRYLTKSKHFYFSYLNDLYSNSFSSLNDDDISIRCHDIRDHLQDRYRNALEAPEGKDD